MEEANSGFRKKFKGPGLSLPPIHEGQSTHLPQEAGTSPSSQSTAQSTTSSQLFLSRKPTRRASIASFSSVKNEVKLHEIKAQLRRDSLKHSELMERTDALAKRFEMLQKKTFKSTDAMPRDTKRRRQSMVALSPQTRRQSIVTLVPPARRQSFRSIGGKVTNLLRAKRAFHKGIMHKPSVEVEEDDVEKASEIKDLPKEPRFASTLSVEAQYAMMKGYEDIVYGYLSRSFPEYRPLLRRNRTPLTGVRVKVPEVIAEEPTRYFGDSDDSDDEIARDSDTKSPTSKTSTDGPSSPRVLKKRSTSPTSYNSKTTIANDQSEYSFNRKGYNRALTPPYYRSLPSSVASQRVRESDTNLARYQSLPHLVPKDKQLVMTYRYHSAMDILDELKKRIGLQATSPRVNKGDSIEPVREFNLWSCVWNKEFEAVQTPTTTC